MNTRNIISYMKCNWIKMKRKLDLPHHIVIKVTPECNLRCEYCYVNGEIMKTHHFINAEYVEKIFDELFSNSNHYEIICCFHGGEPLLYLDKIEEIINILKAKYYSKRIKFQLQTNATLINAKNIIKIRKLFSSVGISIDGINEINDLTRKCCGGSGSFTLVEKAVNLLRDNNVNIGVLSVVTKKNIDHIIDMLVWCAKHNINSLGLEPLSLNGRGSECKDISLDATEYYEGMKKVLKWCIEHNMICSSNEKIYIRDFENVAIKVLNIQKSVYMCCNIPCGAGIRHISLNYDGKVYLCDSFNGDDKFCLGNIQEEKLINILNSSLVEEFKNRKIEDIKECAECSNKNICLHGCVAKEYYRNQVDYFIKRDYFCFYYYSLANDIKELLLEKKIDTKLIIRNYGRI